MSQLDKLIQKILSLSTNLRFEELKKILEAYGYTANTTGTGGSHITFRKKGCNPITIPKHKKLLVYFGALALFAR